MQAIRTILIALCASSLCHWTCDVARAQTDERPLPGQVTQTLKNDLDQMELSFSGNEDPERISSQLISLPAADSNSARTTASTQSQAELVIQRFPDGKHQIERQVVLDAEGNYVNHGTYQEWNEKGDLIVTGIYSDGRQHGLWVRFCNSNDSKIFTKDPYSKFKAPFQSSVEFEAGKLNGIWTITDKDGRTVSQIQFEQGVRNGPAVWYHTTGVPVWHSEYRDGLLNGLFVENDAQGKQLREVRYESGRRLGKKLEYYANKKLKSELEYLGPAQSLKTSDDWNRTVLATYELSGTEIKHGSHTVYFDNGSVRFVAEYTNGKPNGVFESWHSNGQKEVKGTYAAGVQQGEWNWWHPNGMRRSSVVYHNGNLKGETLAWNESGKRIQAGEALVSVSLQLPTTTVRAETVQFSKRPGTEQRAASDGRQPGTR